jgi:hypothetical protein
MYQKKLDWLVMDTGLTVTAKQIGNEAAQQCSDHMWVHCDVKVVKDNT